MHCELAHDQPHTPSRMRTSLSTQTACTILASPADHLHVMMHLMLTTCICNDDDLLASCDD